MSQFGTILTAPFAVRRSWGFMCPVHTPDGSPCGLLMHLTMHCQVVTTDRDKEADAISARLANTLLEWGMLPASTGLVPPSPPSHLAVMQDGRLIGTLRATAVEKVVERLRTLKTERELPADLEVGDPRVFLYFESLGSGNLRCHALAA
jgi:DNA-directed RNA polymerase I subunit RPA2